MRRVSKFILIIPLFDTYSARRIQARYYSDGYMAEQELKFKVHHMSGKQNVVAGVLSCYPPNTIEKDNDEVGGCFLPAWLAQDYKDPDYEEQLLPIYR